MHHTPTTEMTALYVPPNARQRRDAENIRIVDRHGVTPSCRSTMLRLAREASAEITDVTPRIPRGWVFVIQTPEGMRYRYRLGSHGKVATIQTWRGSAWL